MQEFKSGDWLEVETTEGTYVGILMERPKLADDKHMVIKLESGYNIGINKEKIKNIKKIERKTRKDEYTIKKHTKDLNKPSISILATGGTIASRVDYITGGVHSAFSAEDLISAVPELGEVANVTGRQICNKFSENIIPADWIKIAEAAAEEIKNGAAGVVITHGTDTMGYTAAALAFMLKTPVPAVITGAQRSSDRGSSDAATNLTHAAMVAAKGNFSEVVVVMHAESSDSFSYIHPATKVKKLHASKRDAFMTVNAKPFGSVSAKGVELVEEVKRGEKLSLDTKLNENVFLLKYAPGIKPGALDAILKAGYEGIVIEGTGLGHTSDELAKRIGEAIKSGIPIAMTSQTIFGRVNMSVYSTGRVLLDHGVIPCEDMLSETAYVKLMWVLGHTKDQKKVKEMMATNYAREIGDRTTFDQPTPKNSQ
jgi:glutamyl-tRNA(Gln) amidotransferase subunit D